MRILLFTGKGGVGKTSLAAATGVKLAQLGHRQFAVELGSYRRFPLTASPQ